MRITGLRKHLLLNPLKTQDEVKKIQRQSLSDVSWEIEQMVYTLLELGIEETKVRAMVLYQLEQAINNTPTNPAEKQDIDYGSFLPETEKETS